MYSLCIYSVQYIGGLGHQKNTKKVPSPTDGVVFWGGVLGEGGRRGMRRMRASTSLSISISLYIYIHIHTHIYIYVYVYAYVHMYTLYMQVAHVM